MKGAAIFSLMEDDLSIQRNQHARPATFTNNHIIQKLQQSVLYFSRILYKHLKCAVK